MVEDLRPDYDDHFNECETCEGSGICPDCDGEGCEECGGTGDCPVCGGTGEAG